MDIYESNHELLHVNTRQSRWYNTMPQERWVLIVYRFPSETEGIKQER